MKLHTLALLAFAALAAGALNAQATENLNGTVPDDADHVYLIEVDFGGAASSITLTLNISATSGTSGLDVALVDLDELAQNGSATGVQSDFDAGTGLITLTMVTPSYSGVRQFSVNIGTDSSNGSSPYTGTLATNDLPPGAIVEAGLRVWPYVSGYSVIFDRAARNVIENTAPGTFTRDVSLDFGAGTQAATFYVQSFSFFSDGTVQVFEIDTGGAEVLLGTLTLNSGTGWEEEANLTTSARTGPVTIRVRVNAADVLYFWTLVVPDFVTVNAPPKKKGGGGDDGGCSSTDTPGLGLLALLGVIAAAGAGARLLRR